MLTTAPPGPSKVSANWVASIGIRRLRSRLRLQSLVSGNCGPGRHPPALLTRTLSGQTGFSTVPMDTRLWGRHETAFASRATASATVGPNITSSLWLAPRITTRSTRVGASSATRALSSVGTTESRSP